MYCRARGPLRRQYTTDSSLALLQRALRREFSYVLSPPLLPGQNSAEDELSEEVQQMLDNRLRAVEVRGSPPFHVWITTEDVFSNRLEHHFFTDGYRVRGEAESKEVIALEEMYNQARAPSQSSSAGGIVLDVLEGDVIVAGRQVLWRRASVESELTVNEVRSEILRRGVYRLWWNNCFHACRRVWRSAVQDDGR